MVAEYTRPKLTYPALVPWFNPSTYQNLELLNMQRFFYKICTETPTSLFSAAIERLFSRMFKTNIQIEGFYSLLITEASSNIEVQFKK